MGINVIPYAEIAGLTGPQGPAGQTGTTGPTGPTGPAGAPGLVQSVNGRSQADITLTAADVGASPLTGAFTPESLGVKAWAGDPATCASGFDYCGVGTGRMTAVYLPQTTTVSKIVWHFMGYAGGLQFGSWAGIYNTAGTRLRATGDMSAVGYEPAEQHDLGGGASASNLSSSVTLNAGVYYVLWRFQYTASPVDGPALLRWDSSSACPNVFGLNGVRRHGTYSTSATTSPLTITPASFALDAIRFWVALA